MIDRQAEKVKTQKEIFLEGEGDKWFHRNMSTQPSKDVFLYERFIKNGDCILEVGCSNGKNLTHLVNNGGHRCVWSRPF